MGTDLELPPKVIVAVSQAMDDLRKVQTILNHFLWSTELSYGFVLRRASFNRESRAIEVMNEIATEAWYPSRQGRIKYDVSVGDFLDHVAENTTHLYRMVLVNFFAAFERFLEERLVPVGIRPKPHWGPYVRALAKPLLSEAPYPLRSATVLAADICRNIRNRIVHPPFQIPDAVDDPLVQRWISELVKEGADRWPEPVTTTSVTQIVDYVVGEASRELTGAKDQGKNLPIEFFYTLFTFANLDRLAFEIEEALIPADETLTGRIYRAEVHVRRNDLKIRSPLTPPASNL